MITPLMIARTHSHRPSIEQVKAQVTEALRKAQQLAETIAVATEPITEAGPTQVVAEVG